jgi:upstream activation factor subunit UAF30
MATQVAIKELIMQRFDIVAAETNMAAGASTANGSATEYDIPTKPASTVSHSRSSSSPRKRTAELNNGGDMPGKTPPKRRKEEILDSDAAYAAKLQAEENLRARPTRGAKGANTRKAPVKKKKPSTKGSKKVVSPEDDSDVDASGSEPKKEVNRTGGFHVGAMVLNRWLGRGAVRMLTLSH